MSEKNRRAPRIFARVEEKDGARRGALHLYDAVGWDGIRAKDVVEKLEAIKDEGAEHLDIFINSPGGEVFDGLAVYSAISSWTKGKKRVHIDGLAASVASVIAMAGDEIEISPAGILMVHLPAGFVMGNAADMRKMADRLDSIRDVICGIYAERTGLSKVEVEKLVEEETWMTANEAVEKGFADVVSQREAEKKDSDDAGDDEGADDSLARAMTLFKKAPADVAKLLNLRCAAVAASSLPPKEPPMPENTPAAAPAAVDPTPVLVSLNTKPFEDRIAALTARAETVEKDQAGLLGVIGKATLGEAMAMVAGLKEKAGRADELAAQLAKLEAEKRAGQVAALLDTASREGRLTPAKREELMKADAPAFARDPTQLQVFLDCLQPVVVAVAAPKHEEPQKDPVASLTEDEKLFAAQLKVDQTKVAAFKAKTK
jgi:ATP-dependent Clp protease protease subunit